MADLGKAGARGAGITIVGQGARFVLQFGSILILARLLTKDDFGLVAMCTAITGVAEIVRDFGLSSAAIQAKTLSNAQRSNLFWINAGIGVLCALIVGGGAPLIAALYQDQRVIAIVLALSPLFIIGGMNTQLRADLSRNLRFKNLVITDVSAQTLGVVVAITLAFFGAGYWSIVGQQAAFVITGFLLNAFFCRWVPARFDRSVPMGSFFRYGGSVLGVQMLGYATDNVDNVALGATWGAGPLGLYSRAYQLLLVPINQINAPLTRVVLPILSRVQEDREALQRYAGKTQLIGSYVLGPLFAVAAALASPLVAILFGAEWMGMVPIFTLLAIGGVIRGHSQVPYWIYLATGTASKQLRMYLWLRPLMVVIILAGLPWGAVGVACSQAVAFTTYWLVSMWRVGVEAQVNTWVLVRRAFTIIAIFTAPAAVVAHLATRLVDPPAAQLALGLVAAFAMFALIGFLVPTVRGDLTSVAGAALGRRKRGGKGGAKVSGGGPAVVEAPQPVAVGSSSVASAAPGARMASGDAHAAEQGIAVAEAQAAEQGVAVAEAPDVQLAGEAEIEATVSAQVAAEQASSGSRGSRRGFGRTSSRRPGGRHRRS